MLLAIHALACLAFFPAFFSWSAVGIAIALYAITAIGVTLGYHRLLAHRSFRVPTALERGLAVVGVLAFQHGPIEWVAQHRAHHARADREGDPHSATRGLRWSHIEWIYRPNRARVTAPDRARWTPDLIEDPFYRTLDRTHAFFQVALAIALYAMGGWSFVIWGVFARLAFTYHCTWLVNSAGHTFGYRTYETPDRSRNNWLVAMLTFGEGWHNNHHAFPSSAKHGLAWYEFDATFAIVRIFEIVGLARNVKRPANMARERGAPYASRSLP